MYGTISDWRAYATARGFSAPGDASDTLATAALIRASDYIKYTYVQHFTSGYDDTLEVVEFAAYEAALLELETPGFFTASFTPAEQKVLTEVKGIKWTVVGGAEGAEGATPVSTKVDAMLAHMVGKNRGIGIMSVGP